MRSRDQRGQPHATWAGGFLNALQWKKKHGDNERSEKKRKNKRRNKEEIWEKKEEKKDYRREGAQQPHPQPKELRTIASWSCNKPAQSITVIFLRVNSAATSDITYMSLSLSLSLSSLSLPLPMILSCLFLPLSVVIVELVALLFTTAVVAATVEKLLRCSPNAVLYPLFLIISTTILGKRIKDCIWAVRAFCKKK